MPYALHHKKEKEIERAKKRRLEGYKSPNYKYIPKDKTNWNKKENNPFWKGGITKLYEIIHSSDECQQWRSDIFQKDNWTCQTCGKRGNMELNAHHVKEVCIILKENQIKDWQEAKKCKELWNLNNGVTLCKLCHRLVHTKR